MLLPVACSGIYLLKPIRPSSRDKASATWHAVFTQWFLWAHPHLTISWRAFRAIGDPLWLVYSAPLFLQTRNWSSERRNNLLMTHSWLMKALLSSWAIFPFTTQQLVVACQQTIQKKVKGPVRQNAGWSENLFFTVSQHWFPVFREIVLLQLCLKNFMARETSSSPQNYKVSVGWRKCSRTRLGAGLGQEVTWGDPLLHVLCVSFCVSLHLKIKVPLLKIRVMIYKFNKILQFCEWGSESSAKRSHSQEWQGQDSNQGLVTPCVSAMPFSPHVCTHAHTHSHTHIHMNSHNSHTNIHTCSHIHTYANIHISTHANTLSHTYTHTFH